jgi:glycerophosphoryl diester phosphodiesterase
MHVLGRDSGGAAASLSERGLPPVIGHRGAAGCAPENTLAGLRRAAALGCRWVEFDVRLTADGELVLLHDARLERTTDGRGKARALPLSAIRLCDAGNWFNPRFAGERVPTLAEAIAVLAELGIGANVELKAAGRGCAVETGVAAADLLIQRWPPQLPAPLISSFVTEALATARRRAPAITGGLLVRGVPRNWRRRAEALGCATVNADQRLLRPAIVAEIRRAGYPVLAYTVNDAARARELFDWGVVSVFSDVPHVILAALSAGLPRPRAAPPGLPATARREAQQ